MFTLVTATPAGLGLILGGHLADTSGRRRLIAIALPVSTAFIVVSYSVGGPVMWVSVLLGAVIGGIAFPALAVYRAELFPTGNRGRAAGLLTAAALLGGVVGLVVTGQALDAGAPHGLVLGAAGQRPGDRGRGRADVAARDGAPRPRRAQPARPGSGLSPSEA